MSEKKPRTLEDVVAWIHAHEAMTEERWTRVLDQWAEKKSSDNNKFNMVCLKLDEAEKHISSVELRLMYLCGVGSCAGAIGGTLLSMLISHLSK